MMKLATAPYAATLLIALSTLAGAQSTEAQMQPAPTDSAGSAAKGTIVGPGDAPQAGVPVQIIGPPGQTIAITDKNGTWSVYNLPAGDYKVKTLGTEHFADTKQVTFSVKEKSLWSKFTGGTTDIVKSPQIKLETPR